MTFLFCSHSCNGNAQKQGTEFKGQMRTADDVEGTREGRDIIQCRGSCLNKTRYIGVATIGKMMCIIIWHVQIGSENKWPSYSQMPDKMDIKVGSKWR